MEKIQSKLNELKNDINLINQLTEPFNNQNDNCITTYLILLTLFIMLFL